MFEGRVFKYEGANETAFENLHKDTAIWSCLFVFYPVATSDDMPLINTSEGGAAEVGIRCMLRGDEKFEINVYKGAGGTAFNLVSASALSTSAWHVLGWSIDEPSGASSAFIHLDGTGQTAVDATYTTPSSAAAGTVMNLGTREDGEKSLASGYRIAIACLWEGTALSSANFDSIWTEIKGRFDL